MNIPKLEIQITEPIAQAEINILKHAPSCYYEFSWPTGKPDLYYLNSKNGLGKVLLVIMKYPNMNWNHIYMNSDVKHWKWAGDYIQLAYFAGLITNKVPKTYKGNNPGYRITKLGLAVLKQNELI